MKLIKRVAFYSGGFIIGLILLFFFLGGKKASCDYSPNARTLKNIRIKDRIVSENTLQTLKQHQMDTAVISTILDNGKVLFSESDTSLDSCKIYMVRGRKENRKLRIKVENCENKATVLEAIFQKE
jgi:hypothetical protein